MSQTFDLHVHLAESGLQEFSPHSQAEASSLQQYMTNRGIKIAGQDQAPAMAKAQAVAGDGSGSDSEEVQICPESNLHWQCLEMYPALICCSDAKELVCMIHLTMGNGIAISTREQYLKHTFASHYLITNEPHNAVL